MDPLGGFRAEVFRPALILMIPGLIAGSPALFVLQHYQPSIFSFAQSHPTLATFLGVISSAIFGLFSYEIGTNIEAHWIDKRLKKRDNKFETEWYTYLRCELPETAVAHTYIHDRVLYLKFELGMAAALPLCLALSTWLLSIHDDFHCGWYVALAAGLIVGTLYFLFEAFQSAKGLARVRKELLKGIGRPPKCNQA